MKTIAAVHSQCRCWVIRDQASQHLWPINVRYAPNSDQKWCSATNDAKCQKATSLRRKKAARISVASDEPPYGTR